MVIKGYDDVAMTGDMQVIATPTSELVKKNMVRRQRTSSKEEMDAFTAFTRRTLFKMAHPKLYEHRFLFAIGLRMYTIKMICETMLRRCKFKLSRYRTHLKWRLYNH